jgi:hypothetical protein
MNFKQYLKLQEGQAMGLSQDMAKFAQEASGAIQQGWEYEKPVYQRQVSGDKYGTKNVFVVPKQRPQNDTGFGYSDPQKGEIGIYLQPKQNVDAEDFIQHELIHIFDPKITNNKLRNAPWGIDAQNQQSLHATTGQNTQYYTNPWEQDAFMRQSAEATIRNKSWLFDGDQNAIQQSLQRMKPQDAWEQEWYKNPKMWRKYLNTIYQIVAQQKPMA